MRILEFEVYTKSLSSIFNDCNSRCIISTINPHSYIIAMNDEEFSDALKSSDVLLPDGSGILLAAAILNGKRIEKKTGPDSLRYALNRLNKTKSRVYFLGSTDKTLDLITTKVTYEYENIELKTYSPPFCRQFTPEENDSIIEDIRNFKPDLICVGMTAPKQEKWVYENQQYLPECYIMSIGAAFDWFSGAKKEPSDFAKMFHIAWLERFAREPVRMLPRIGSMFKFLYIIFSAKLAEKVK